jgi:CRISPR/Cas system endoribonuclease Cas6 (RAMP superfamily)
VIECLVGTIDVECNALGRWLLDVAALIGLGSKTSIGFGRVRVEDL